MYGIKSLVNVFKIKPTSESYKKKFARHFDIEDSKVYVWSQVEGFNHYRWLQGRIAHLSSGRQLKYVGVTMRQFFYNFLQF